MAAEGAYINIVENAEGQFDWAVYGANGEYICGTKPQGNQGFRDKTDAQRSVWDAYSALGSAITDERITTFKYDPVQDDYVEDVHAEEEDEVDSEEPPTGLREAQVPGQVQADGG
jgi:hypothetical protein